MASPSDEEILLSVQKLMNMNENQKQKNGKKRKKPKNPNFFLAIRITDENVLQSIKTVQEQLRHYEGVTEQRLEELAKKSHLTLFVVRIENSQELKEFIEILQKAKDIFYKYFASSEYLLAKSCLSRSIHNNPNHNQNNNNNDNNKNNIGGNDNDNGNNINDDSNNNNIDDNNNNNNIDNNNNNNNIDNNNNNSNIDNNNNNNNIDNNNNNNNNKDNNNNNNIDDSNNYINIDGNNNDNNIDDNNNNSNIDDNNNSNNIDDNDNDNDNNETNYYGIKKRDDNTNISIEHQNDGESKHIHEEDNILNSNKNEYESKNLNEVTTEDEIVEAETNASESNFQTTLLRCLSVKGVGHFRDKPPIIWAGLDESQPQTALLKQFVAELHAFVKANGDKFLVEEFNYMPHITIFKGSREKKKPKKKKKKKKSSKKEKTREMLTSFKLADFWKQFENFCFGEQIIETIELLQMRTVDDFYPCFAKQHVTEQRNFELEWLIREFGKSEDNTEEQDNEKQAS